MFESAAIVGGVNLFAYCSNNPVMLIDPNGDAWWHWVVGAAVVVGFALATVGFAGGLALAAITVGNVAGGLAVSGIGATIFASGFIASLAFLGTMGISAGIDAVGTWSSTGSFNSGVNTFMNSPYSHLAAWGTPVAGVLGMFNGYFMYKMQNTYYANIIEKNPIGRTSYATEIQMYPYKKVIHFDGAGKAWWSKHYTTHNFSNHKNPHWHLEFPHQGPYNNIFTFAKEFIKRLFGG